MSVEFAAVGRLLSYALDPKLTPAKHSDYADLVAMYRSDPEFASAMQRVAEGQGLIILECSPLLGLVLAASAESPYQQRLEDYVTTSAEERLLHGLIHLVIAATAFPNAQALETDDRLPSVTAQEVHERLEFLARRFRAQVGEDADPPADAPLLEPVWRLILRTRATDATPDGRSNPRTLLGMVRKALRFLEDQGLAEEVPLPKAEFPDTYRLRARYRLHVLDAAHYVAESQAMVAGLLRDYRAEA
jgi:hypothetical protein